MSTWGSGNVTAPGVPSAAPPPLPGPPASPPSGPPRRRQLLVFGGIAGAIFVVGLAVLLVVMLSSGRVPLGPAPQPPTDVRPPLAQACPAPTVPPGAEPSAPSAPPAPVSGPRTVDREAGISYRAYGPPWHPWSDVWRAGTLEVPYRVGQDIITEVYPGGDYHASILSAAVPAADNDAVTIDLGCIGRQVAADVRAEYYPQPNTIDVLRGELTTLGGRPAWVSKFRLHFDEPGLKAKDELSAVAVIDVGKPSAAVLYISIPGTVRQYDPIVDEVLASVRPL